MDLNAPLGLEPRPRRRRLLPIVAGLAVVALVAGSLAAVATGGPRALSHRLLALVGAPTVQRTAANTGATPLDATPTGTLPPAAPPSARTPELASDDNVARMPGMKGTATASNAAPPETTTLENGVRVHRGGSVAALSPASGVEKGSAGGGPLVIDVTRNLDAKIKKDGGKAAAATVTTPRIALYVSGMGLSQSATRTAIDTLPAEVSLAFLPYAAGPTIEAARAKGHEILLQLPMENGVGSAPGPHALKPDEAPDALAKDLDFATSHVPGFIGVTNLLGAPVTANVATMTAVMKATAARNLFFLDDGTSKRSVATSLASTLNVRAIQADLVVDATAQPAVVRANLDNLVAIARRKGFAIGMASGLPEHLPLIARFAGELAAKGIALVPVSTVANRDNTVAAAGSQRDGIAITGR